jgi:hypothetical protein
LRWAVEGNGGLPLEAEYDQALGVVMASRVLSPDEYADLRARECAEAEARTAVETEMTRRSLDYNEVPIRGWMRVQPLSGGPPQAHHFEFRARVRRSGGVS